MHFTKWDNSRVEAKYASIFVSLQSCKMDALSLWQFSSKTTLHYKIGYFLNKTMHQDLDF